MSIKKPRWMVIGLVALVLAAVACNMPGCGAQAQQVPGVTPTSTPLPRVDPKDLPDTAPRVVAQRPLKGEELPLDGAVDIYFDQPMDQASVEAALDTGSLTGELTWVDDSHLRITPGAGQLQRAQRYMVVVNEGAQAANGLALEAPVEVPVQTVGFLEVTETVPADESEAVAANAKITVMFNRPVVPLGLASDETLDLPDPLNIQPAVGGSGEWVNTSIYQFTPDPALAGSTTYTVSIAAGLEDQTGGILEEGVSWSFTTLPPSVISVTPEDPVSVGLDQDVVVTFNQPMDRASVESYFRVEGQGAAVPGSFDWNDDSSEVTFTPSGLYAYGTDYNIVIGANAAGAGDQTTLGGDVNWGFTTVAVPAVEDTTPDNGEGDAAVWSGLQFHFSAPMDEDTLDLDLVEVSPALPEDISDYYSTYDNTWNINAYLEPSTTYEVTLQPGAADPYGTTIGQPYTFRFTTGPLDPQVTFNTQGRYGIYDADQPTELFALYRNVSRIDFSLARLSQDDFARLTGPGSYDAFQNFAPSANNTVGSWSVPSEGALNEAVYARVPVTDESGASLSPGFYFLIADAPEIEGDVRHLMIVVNANLTFKTSFDEALAWVTDLHSGQPVSGVSVSYYDDTFRGIGQATTDGDGVASGPIEAQNNLWDLRYAIAEGGGTFAVAMSEWEDGIQPWAFGNLPTQFNREDYSIYLYTERPIYRPGQQVDFKGVIRAKDDVTYSLPTRGNVTVNVYNDQGDVIYESTLPLSEMGTFNGTVQLDDQAGLGYYSIEVLAGEDVRSGLGFQVADYRAPEYQVSVTPKAEQVLAGNQITVTVDAEYFFGGAVSGADVSWTVLSDQYRFQPDVGGRYSFYDYDQGQQISEDFIPGFGEVIADGTGTTNDAGQYVLKLPADLTAVDSSRSLTIEAVVTDVDERQVAGRTQVVVHKGRLYAGVQPSVYVAQAGDDFDADLIVLDWNAEPQARQEVSVQLVEQKWNSVKEEDEFGRTQWTWSVEEIPVGQPETVTSDANGRASATLSAPRGGTYKIVASVTDSAGNEQVSSSFIWVSGSQFIAWRQTNDDRMDLIADKTTYQPGDTAEILIASPFQGSVEALVTVERGSILSQEVITLTSNSTVYKLPITGDLAPNVFVSVVVVKGVDDTNPNPAFKLGYVKLGVDPIEQTVDLTVTPSTDQAEPRDTVTYTIEARDYQGNPVDAEVSLALVDLAVLSIAPPNSGPITDHFYGSAGLAVRTSVPLTILVNRLNQELFDQGKGGGGGGGEGFFEVRGDFRDTAYWEASVRTGDDGEATVDVTLPDNLTTWRMDARAVTADTLVGQTEVDIVTTKPLLIRPVTPRFFIAADEVTLSAVVNNNTENAIEAEVGLQDVTGLIVSGDTTQTVSVPAGGRAEAFWPVSVDPAADWVNVVFTAEGGGLSDASKPTVGDPAHDRMLPVYRFEVPETVGTAGQLIDEGTRNEGVVLPPTYDVTQGNITVRIDPSLASATIDGLDYLEHFPYECTEQTVSRFLPNALTVRTLHQFGIEDADLQANLDRQIQIGLQRLYSQQHIDGGWGWFVTDDSNPVVTSYVLQGLLAAQDGGYTVETRVINDAISYLQEQIQPLNNLSAQWELNRQAYIVWVLAEAGQPEASATTGLYDARQSLSIYAQALVAQALHTIDPSDPRLANLKSDLTTQAIVSATGAHWEEGEPDPWNWNTDTRTTAIVLSTFARLWPDTDLGPNVVRWLMIARQADHWETTQETAWALMGLTEWMSATGELNAGYQWTFDFNTIELASGQANASTVGETSQITVDVREMLEGVVNTLTFERTAGPGRMYYTAHLTAYLPVEEVDPLSRGIIVSRRYLDENGKPITSGIVGDTITVEVSIVAPHDLNYVVVEDYYPAGAEAVDTNLLTESILSGRPELQPDDPLARGWGWWWFSQTDLRDEKAVLFADYLPAGTYTFKYELRLGLAGEYRVIPPVAQEFYFPEVYGRGAGSLFAIHDAP